MHAAVLASPPNVIVRMSSSTVVTTARDCRRQMSPVWSSAVSGWMKVGLGRARPSHRRRNSRNCRWRSDACQYGARVRGAAHPPVNWLATLVGRRSLQAPFGEPDQVPYWPSPTEQSRAIGGNHLVLATASNGGQSCHSQVWLLDAGPSPTIRCGRSLTAIRILRSRRPVLACRRAPSYNLWRCPISAYSM